MRWLFFWAAGLYAYDCILIGSSPFSLLEALCQAKEGKEVLIIEEADRCGGAWRSVDLCGLAHVDAACHFLGASPELLEFLSSYVGCHFKEGYFEAGCHELIDHLTAMLHNAGGTLLLNTAAQEVFFEKETVFVHTTAGLFATDKLIVTPMSRLVFPQAGQKTALKGSTYYHLALRLDRPQHFYAQGGVLGCRRMMQWGDLFLIQIEEEPADPEAYFAALKEEGVIAPQTELLGWDTILYTPGACHEGFIQKLQAGSHIEMLQTGAFSHLARYIKLLEPYKEFAYTGSDSKIGSCQGAAPGLDPMKPTPKEPNLSKLGDAGARQGDNGRTDFRITSGM